MADKWEIRVPDGVELSDADKARIRAELEGVTVEKLQGTRAELVFVKEKDVFKDVEEVAKGKSVPIERIKGPGM
jgi:hypothetical protein